MLQTDGWQNQYLVCGRDLLILYLFYRRHSLKQENDESGDKQFCKTDLENTGESEVTGKLQVIRSPI